MFRNLVLNKSPFHKTLDYKYGLIKIPKGWIAVGWSKKGITGVVFPRSTSILAYKKLTQINPFLKSLHSNNKPSAVPAKYRRSIKRAFSARHYPIPSTDVSFMTSFQQKVLACTSKIPRGKTQTYTWVAHKSGSSKAFRAVGQALTSNPVPIFIPCHRVIAANNRLGGYASGLSWKMNLLKSEGIHVRKISEGSYRVELL